MRTFCLASVLCSAAITSGVAGAADHAEATVDVACSGKPGARVAIRWGSPNYDSDPIKFMGLFKVDCDGPGAPKTIHKPPISPVRVTAPDSTFEVQTEGGIETSYDITVTLNSQKPPLTNSFHLVHAGSPTTVFSGKGFTMQRTAGPDKYGEQNFRVIFTAPLPVSAKVGLQSGGDRSDAQVALRWGHPNYNSKGYLKLWKVKPGPRQTQQFPITDKSSEFELQTEGGEHTTYSMWVWFNGAQGETDIDIEHSLNTQPDFSSGITDMTFEPTHGNIYGEGNVKVHIPWLIAASPVTKPTAPVTLNLLPQGTWFAGNFGSLGAAGELLTIANGENFAIQIIADQNMPGGCNKPGNTNLTAHQTVPAAQIFGSNVNYPKTIGACTSSALTTGREGLAVVLTYQPN